MKQELEILAEQIDARELHLAGFKLSFDDTENLLILRKGNKRMAIKYDSGRDTYKVIEQTSIIKAPFHFEQKVLEDIYADELKESIQNFFNFEYVMNGLHIEGVEANE